MTAVVKPTIRGCVLEFLKQNQIECVDRETFQRIQNYVFHHMDGKRRLSKQYLLDILLSTKLEVDRRVGGFPVNLRNKVKTGSLTETRKSLIAMSNEYKQATDQLHAKDIHRAVIYSKEHIRLSLGSKISEEKRTEKQEILDWLLVWLENPRIFENWISVKDGLVCER